MAYSVRDIEDAFKCAGHPQDTPTLQDTKGRIFNHLEGRCGCLTNRCPACGERQRNGEAIHKMDCPMLRC